jgi:hypothetical protein
VNRVTEVIYLRRVQSAGGQPDICVYQSRAIRSHSLPGFKRAFFRGETEWVCTNAGSDKGKQYNFTLAATNALFTVAQKLIFDKGLAAGLSQSIAGQIPGLPSIKKPTKTPLAFGEAVGNAVLDADYKRQLQRKRVACQNTWAVMTTVNGNLLHPNYNEVCGPFLAYHPSLCNGFRQSVQGASTTSIQQGYQQWFL